jgi:tetratricopeptide (TPR) repeat protein
MRDKRFQHEALPLPAADPAKGAEPTSPPNLGGTRARKRRVVLLVGFIALLGGALYSYWARESNEETKAWEAYRGKDYDGAIALFTEALGNHPDNAHALAGRAWAHLGKRQWQKAVADSTAALRLDPQLALAYNARGDAQAGLKHFDAALADLDEAIRLEPRSATAYCDRARVRYARADHADEGLADLTEALRLDPTFAAALSLQAMIFYESKRYDEAIDASDRALASDPQDAAAYLWRGYARLGKGLIHAGEADIQNALKLDPGLVSALQKKP